MVNVTPTQLREQQQAGNLKLIDVRSPQEYALIRAQGAENIPLNELDPGRVAHLDRHHPIYVICKSGGRSQVAVHLLHAMGFKVLFNIAGGTDAWAAAGLPVERAPALAR